MASGRPVELCVRSRAKLELRSALRSERLGTLRELQQGGGRLAVARGRLLEEGEAEQVGALLLAPQLVVVVPGFGLGLG